MARATLSCPPFMAQSRCLQIGLPGRLSTHALAGGRVGDPEMPWRGLLGGGGDRGCSA